jgi:hypothetical protein
MQKSTLTFDALRRHAKVKTFARFTKYCFDSLRCTAKISTASYAGDRLSSRMLLFNSSFVRLTDYIYTP